MVAYLAEFFCCSGLFYALYRLVIEGRVAHRSARAYIVATTLLAVVIPLLELPIYPAESLQLQIATATSNIDIWTIQPANEAVGVDWLMVVKYVVVAIYVAVVVLNFIRLAMRLCEVYAIRRASKLTFYEAYTLAESRKTREPFSFWRTIYLNDKFDGEEREVIITHEYSHVRHRHTAERLAVELIRCIFWINPFVWLAGNSLVEVQEWEADRDVIDKGYDVGKYRLLVFQQLYGYYPEVTCGLKSQTSKKRFLMMTNFKKGRYSPLRLCAAIPMIAGMILAFGAVRAEGKLNKLPKEWMPSELPKEWTPAEMPKEWTPTEIPQEWTDQNATKNEDVKVADLLQRFSNYCKANIRYPADAKAESADGQVVVEFSVNLTDGSAEVRKIHRSPDARLTAEVERVIRKSKWEPVSSVAGLSADADHTVVVILTFDFVIDGKSDMSKFKNKINNIVVKTY